MPKAIWLLILGMAVQSAGLSFFWPFTTIYVHTVMHRSLTAAGLVLMAQAASSTLGSTLGGHLFDRVGGLNTVAVGLAGAILSLVALFFAPSFWPYAVLVGVFGFFTGVVAPAMYAFSVTVWPEGGRQAFNAIYVAQNLGVAAGSVAAGVVASIGGLRSTFLANAGMLTAFLAIALFAYRGPAFRRADHQAIIGPGKQRRSRPPLVWPAALLLVGLVLDWTAYAQWTTTTSSYIHREGFSLPLYTLLWTINGGVILLGQPLSMWISRVMPRIKSQLLLGNGFFLASYVVLMLTHRYTGYVGAMVLTTLGEMLVWPGVPAQTHQITPEEHVGFYQGLVTGAGSAGRMVGPVLGGILYADISRFWLYAVMALLFMASSAFYYVHDRNGSRTGLTTGEDWSSAGPA